MTRKLFPEDEDTTGFDGSLIAGAAQIVADILAAPTLVVNYAVDTVTDIASHAVEKTGIVAKKVVTAAGGVVREAAGQVSSAVEDAIPWKLLLGGAAVLVLLVGGVVVLARSGAIKQVGGIVRG